MYLCILCYCDACLKSSALRVGVKTLCNTPCQLVVSVVQEAGVQGVQAHPQKFWFGENPGKIHGNLGKISENLQYLGKNGAQHDLIWKNGAQRLQNHMKTSFFEGHLERSSAWEMFAQKVVQKFFGQDWGNPGKNLSHP